MTDATKQRIRRGVPVVAFFGFLGGALNYALGAWGSALFGAIFTLFFILCGDSLRSWVRGER